MPQNDCGNHLHSINPSKTGVDSGAEAPTSSLQLLTEMHHVTRFLFQINCSIFTILNSVYMNTTYISDLTNHIQP